MALTSASDDDYDDDYNDHVCYLYPLVMAKWALQDQSLKWKTNSSVLSILMISCPVSTGC